MNRKDEQAQGSELSDQLAVARIYIGRISGKMHLSVCDITLATEGDLCRHAEFRQAGANHWTRALLTKAAEMING